MISRDLIEADKKGFEIFFTIDEDGVRAFVNGSYWGVSEKDIEDFKAYKLKPFQDTIEQISNSSIGIGTCAYLMKLVKKDEKLYWNEFML